jgi:hypothetical protein
VADWVFKAGYERSGAVEDRFALDHLTPPFFSYDEAVSSYPRENPTLQEVTGSRRSESCTSAHSLGSTLAYPTFSRPHPRRRIPSA